MMRLTLEQLCIGYPQHTVAGPLNTSLPEGNLTCLLGPNGAGKSTLLRTLAGFQVPLSGQVCIDDRDISSLSPTVLSTMIGVVLTDRIESSGFTAREVVEMGRSPYTNFFGKLQSTDHEAVTKALHLTGIETLSERKVNALSDGERQKVMIAKALAQGTDIILLDEPTAFLDFPSKVETMLMLSGLCHDLGKSILLSTHDLDLALQTADYLWLLSSQEGFTAGSREELMHGNCLEQFFPSKHISFDSHGIHINNQPK